MFRFTMSNKTPFYSSFIFAMQTNRIVFFSTLRESSLLLYTHFVLSWRQSIEQRIKMSTLPNLNIVWDVNRKVTQKDDQYETHGKSESKTVNFFHSIWYCHGFVVVCVTIETEQLRIPSGTAIITNAEEKYISVVYKIVSHTLAPYTKPALYTTKQLLYYLASRNKANSKKKGI